MILEALSATRWTFGEPPTLGLITFVNPSKVRHKRDPGRCFRRAGFSVIGHTKGGLLALQVLSGDMPAAVAPLGAQYSLGVA